MSAIMNTADTPKALPIAPPGEGTIAKRVAAGLDLRPTPLDEWHLSRLALAYVRQSDPQQVLKHVESRERQYALVDLAMALVVLHKFAVHSRSGVLSWAPGPKTCQQRVMSCSR